MTDDPDTKVLFKIAADFGKYSCTIEVWLWDGIQGNSVIFSNDAALEEDEELRSLVSKSLALPHDAQFTIARNPENVFVNFFLTNKDERSSFDPSQLTEKEKLAKKESTLRYLKESNERNSNPSIKVKKPSL